MKKKKAKWEAKAKCKTVAAAVVKGKIYFYCLKEIRNEWKKFSLSIVRTRASRIYAL